MVAPTRALARGTSADGTTLGKAAAEAGSKGDCTSDETPSRTTSAGARPAVAAIASETLAAPRSVTISTRRRSKRSPTQPANGAATTEATTLEKIAAETQSAEPVSP